MLFKDTREKIVAYVVKINYYYKFNVKWVALACSKNALVCWLLKTEYSADVLVVA